MKKILIIACLGLATNSIGQTIPNPGFETWATSGPFLAPTGWAVSPAVHQSTAAHSGTYALQCTVDTFTNPLTSTLDTIVSNAYSGQQTMGPPTPGALFSGYAFNSKPDSINGWTKYQGSAGDSLRISVTLSYWDTTAGMRRTVASAAYTSGTNSSIYSRFSVPLTYTATHNPDSCLIQIVPANPQGPKHMGTSVWVDDLAFVTNLNLSFLNDAAYNKMSYKVYPVPFSNILHVKSNVNREIKSISILDMSGRTVLVSDNVDINTSVLAPGQYLINITDSNGSVVTKRAVKQ